MLTRRNFLAAHAAAVQRAAEQPPNIVALLADDLGYADVGFHLSEIRTPHLDGLAAQGVRFDRFYSYPLCATTRSALVTGRSPMRLGVVYATIEPFDDYGLPEQEHFLPQSFEAAGYETAMCGKWHLGHRFKKFLPQARGCGRSYGCITGRIAAISGPPFCPAPPSRVTKTFVWTKTALKSRISPPVSHPSCATSRRESRSGASCTRATESSTRRRLPRPAAAPPCSGWRRHDNYDNGVPYATT